MLNDDDIAVMINSYVHPHRHFPAAGDPRENIKTAVTNCTFTICCLCPAIVTKFYQTLFADRKDKIIFLKIGENPKGWRDWTNMCAEIIDCSNAHNVQVGVRRIRQSLDNQKHIRAGEPRSTGTGG